MTYVLASSQEAEQAANFADFQYTIKDLLYLWLYCLWFKSMGNAHQSSERSCNTASSSNDRRVNGFWIVHSHNVLLLLITWVTWQVARDHGALSGMYMHASNNTTQPWTVEGTWEAAHVIIGCTMIVWSASSTVCDRKYGVGWSNPLWVTSNGDDLNGKMYG